MPEPQPHQPPPLSEAPLPFVTITVLANGQIQTQTNLKDRSLILGLLETSKFQIMQPPDPPRIQPVNGGFRDAFRRRMSS